MSIPRCWGIRHCRYYYLRWKFDRWWLHCRRWLWLEPKATDLDYLEDIWHGRA